MATRRQQIASILQDHPCTVRQLAAQLGVPMAEVVHHLTHVQRSLGRRMKVSESRCLACGFAVGRDGRFTAPSRCPRCKSEQTTEPLLDIEPG